MDMKWYRITVLIYFTLMISNIKHHFIGFFAINISSLVAFIQNFNCIFVYLYLSCMSYFYILDPSTF